MEIVECSRGCSRVFGSRPRCVVFRHNSKQGREDASAFQKAKIGKQTLESAKNALEDVLGWITSQLQDCTHQIEAFQLRSIFAAFPDEILFRVLEFAAEEDIENGDSRPLLGDDEINLNYDAMCTSAQNAFKLSHVCRRFRNVLSTSRHWRNICSFMQPGMVSACVERCESTNAPFDVYMVDPMLRDLFPHCPFNKSHLWERFVVDWRDSFESLSDVSFSFANHAINRNYHFPQLSEIIVMVSNTAALDFQRDFHFYAGWSTPSLRSMKTSHIIPVPFSGTSTLHSLSIFMNQGSRDFVRDLRSISLFLKSCPVLKEFSLQVRGATLIDDDPESPPREEQPVRREEMKMVEKLTLSLDNCDTSYMEDLVASIGFPNVSVASLRINGKVNTNFCNNFRILFSGTEDGESFPKLLRPHLVVFRTASSVFLYEPVAFPPYSFFLCPKLVNLKLSLYNITPPNFNEGHCLVPALKSLDFSRSDCMFSVRGEHKVEAEALLRHLKGCGLVRDGLEITFRGIPL
ncbi:hypothetical protein SCHPADRAFT_939851 [Schizopora paradoxa]|uniref:F-box domain-containing protein n=1 Tax=Schizopora paradoxa TaxID=27342 RepID=A0A0H2RQD8_9AGAM|nr:hypothetical protein SCHPADRAFT_939851 [Schizopora paradoxa]